MDTLPPPFVINPLSLSIVTAPPPLSRGVFTSPTQPTLAVGQLVEESPVLVLDKQEWETHGRMTVLDNYAFVWGRRGNMALALGMGARQTKTASCITFELTRYGIAGSMFNHSNQPNLTYLRCTKTNTIKFMTVVRHRSCVCRADSVTDFRHFHRNPFRQIQN